MLKPDLFYAREYLVQIKKMIQNKEISSRMYLMPSMRKGNLAGGVLFSKNTLFYIIFRITISGSKLGMVLHKGLEIEPANRSILQVLEIVEKELNRHGERVSADKKENFLFLVK